MSSPKGPITKFPAEGLRHARRFITSHNKEGQGVFVAADDGDHHRIMVEGLAVANIIYSTKENPVDMNDDQDLVYARDNEACPPSLPSSRTPSPSWQLLITTHLRLASHPRRQRQRRPAD